MESASGGGLSSLRQRAEKKNSRRRMQIASFEIILEITVCSERAGEPVLSCFSSLLVIR